jgi:hypothetical protein
VNMTPDVLNIYLTLLSNKLECLSMSVTVSLS